VCYPNSYRVGMSNLGFHSLFHRTASFQGIRAVRFFIERGSTLFSPDSFIPEKKRLFERKGGSLRGFDVILFTVSYELDYLNIIRMLQLSAVPPVREERDARFPIIISGGIAVSANPFPLSVFSDIVFVGDMDGSLERILEILFRQGFEKSEKTKKLLSAVPGVLLGGKESPERNISDPLREPAHTVVLSPKTEFSNMFLVEIVRGCKGSCSFCMTRCVNRPVRTVRPQKVIERVRLASSYTKRAGLVAPLITDHPELAGIVKEINAFGVRVSFSSMRPDRFTESLAALIKENNQTTVTFAPETGSSTFRKRIGKRIENEEFFKAVETAAAYGVRRIRYYLIYGLPGENDDDIASFGDIAEKTNDIMKRYNGTLYLSINPFIPKKQTPFEDAGIYPLSYYKKAEASIRRVLEPLHILYRFESTRLLSLQYQLSVGGSDTGKLLYRCVLEGSLKAFEHVDLKGRIV
jgi:radical SAM superfamily enzyme YgiQ (UPF0313 family)